MTGHDPEYLPMKNKAISLVLGVLSLSLVSTVQADESTGASAWSHEAEPYLWGAGISGRASLGRATGLPVDASFSDLMDNLEFALMARYEGQHDSGFGLVFDYMFIDLASDQSGPNGVLNADIDQTTTELFGTYRAGETELGYIDVFGGFRFWNVEVGLDVNPAALPGSVSLFQDNSWTDLVVGAKGIRHINDRWDLAWRADIGGAGQDSAVTSHLSLGALYEISDLMTLNLRYQWLMVDFSQGTRGAPGYFEYDVTLDGPLVGLKFRWNTGMCRLHRSRTSGTKVRPRRGRRNPRH